MFKVQGQVRRASAVVQDSRAKDRKDEMWRIRQKSDMKASRVTLRCLDINVI